MTNSFPTRRSSDLLGHGIQILLKRLLIRIERIPDEPAPFPARIAGQPRSGRAALGEGVEIGNPLDLSVQPIGPVMVHAAEVLRVAQPFRPQPASDRQSVVLGKSVSVRVDLGGRRTLKKKTICSTAA